MTSSQVPNGSPEAIWEPADPAPQCPFGLRLDEEHESVLHRWLGGLHARFSWPPPLPAAWLVSVDQALSLSPFQCNQDV